MLADQAGKHDAVFVDSYAGSVGHDACQRPGVRWVEGTATTSTAAPDHPNAIGMQQVADLRGGRGQDGQLTGNPAGLAKRMATVVPAGPVCVLRTSARWRAIQMPLPRRASVLGR